jgi:hypothetical protein
MAIVNSYVSLPEGSWVVIWLLLTTRKVAAVHAHCGGDVARPQPGEQMMLNDREQWGNFPKTVDYGE